MTLLAGFRQGLLIGLAILAVTLPPGGSARVDSPVAALPVQVLARADFDAESPSQDARALADWIVSSRDNRGLAFAVLDKREARLFVFSANARLVGASPVLLGAMRGDDSVAGIGHRPMSQVRPEERTTPAGRFVTAPGTNGAGEDVIWVDYDAAVSMHRLRVVDPKERRLERIASDVAEERRISYGCINVPAAFFETVVRPVLGQAHAVVYVLPEQKPLQAVFPIRQAGAERWRRPLTPES